MKLKIELIDDVRGAWKLLIMHVAALWAVVIGYLVWLVSDPTILLNAWTFLPDDLKSVFPPWVKAVLAGLTFIASIYVARIIKQPVRMPNNLPAAQPEHKP